MRPTAAAAAVSSRVERSDSAVTGVYHCGGRPWRRGWVRLLDVERGRFFFEVLFKFSVCSILLPRSSTLTLSRPGIEPGPTGVPPDSNPVSWPHRRRSWFAVPMASLTPHFEASSRVVGGVVCRPRTSPGPCRVRCAADDESNTRVGVFSRPPPRLQSPTATDTSRKSHG